MSIPASGDGRGSSLFWWRFGVRRAGLEQSNIRCFLHESRHPQCARLASKHQESVQLVRAHQLLHPFPCDSLSQLSGLPFKRRAGESLCQYGSASARVHAGGNFPCVLVARRRRAQGERTRQLPLREAFFINLLQIDAWNQRNIVAATRWRSCAVKELTVRLGGGG